MRLDTPLRAAEVIASDALGLAALQDSGWPSAESGERRISVDHANDTAAVHFVYDTGPYSVYGPLEMDSTEWRPGFISGLSPLTRGATASRTQILEYQRRLDTLASVRTSQVMLGDANPDSHERPVRVELTPSARHSIETSLSFATSEGAGANFDWKRRNMFLGDETLTLQASIATLQQGLGATLTLPHWHRYQQTLLFSAGLQSEETDAFDQTELLLSAGVTRRAGHLEYGAGTRLDISQVTDTPGYNSLRPRPSAMSIRAMCVLKPAPAAITGSPTTLSRRHACGSAQCSAPPPKACRPICASMPAAADRCGATVINRSARSAVMVRPSVASP